MAQTYEITERGTDRETLAFNGLRYWLDLTSDPQNSIGWVVEDERHAVDLCEVAEAAAVPGAREYVIERTRAGIKRAIDRASEFGYDTDAVQSLRDELEEA